MLFNLITKPLSGKITVVVVFVLMFVTSHLFRNDLAYIPEWNKFPFILLIAFILIFYVLLLFYYKTAIGFFNVSFVLLIILTQILIVSKFHLSADISYETWRNITEDEIISVSQYNASRALSWIIYMPFLFFTLFALGIGFDVVKNIKRT